MSRKEQPTFQQESNREEWTTQEALKTRSFQLILLSYFFQVGGIVSLLTFVIPHIQELGIDPLVASAAFGVIGLMSALGSFIFGIVSDRMGRKTTIILTATGITAAMFSSTIIPPDMTWLYAWITLYGLTYGGIREQYAALVADYFQSKEDISLFGYLMFTGALGGALFPVIGGYLYDLTSNYYASLLFLGIGMLSALITILPVKKEKKVLSRFAREYPNKVQ